MAKKNQPAKKNKSKQHVQHREKQAHKYLQQTEKK